MISRRLTPLFLLFAIPFGTSRTAFCLDAYGLLDNLLPKDQSPRILNSDDISLNPNDPEPLFTPSGDFNQDGIEDIAISGIYDLPSGLKRYFLLVGTQLHNPVRYQKLLFQEYRDPVFIHKPGTTGEKDPSDQSFSITSCSQCTDGTDLYWDNKHLVFTFVPWVKRVRHYQQLTHAPEQEPISAEIRDKALKIAGDLTDVRVFVADLKKRKGDLGSRVERENTTDAPSIVNVSIYEKTGESEKIYDVITVDVDRNVVLKRKKKIKLGK